METIDTSSPDTPETEATAAPKSDEGTFVNVIGRGQVPWTPTSQIAFTSNPFRSSDWTVVKGDTIPRGFQQMELDVVDSPAAFDPMFQQFGDPEAAAHKWNTTTAVEREAQPVLKEGQVLLSAAELDALKKEFHKMGFKSGLAEQNKKADEHAQQLLARLNELQAQFKTQADIFYAKVEQRALELALSVARKILETTREVKPDYILEVIRQGMAALGAAKPMRIRMSHEDYEFVKVVGVPTELSASELGVEYVADEAIKSGCVVETDFGEIDVQLESMWQQIATRLYEVSK